MLRKQPPLLAHVSKKCRINELFERRSEVIGVECLPVAGFGNLRPKLRHQTSAKTSGSIRNGFCMRTIGHHLGHIGDLT